jgi:hypothetical protein
MYMRQKEIGWSLKSLDIKKKEKNSLGLGRTKK